ncbi:MAG: hypothetical protein U0W40_06435 [Acidimicrobiia bacterium]
MFRRFVPPIVVIAALVTAILPAAAQETAAPGSWCAPAPLRTPAAYTDGFVALGQSGAGWVTGDGAVPVRVDADRANPSRVVWLFGDTFVGARNADGSLAPGWTLVHNTLVEQQGQCFHPLVGAIAGAPVSYLATPGADDWLWPTGGFVRGDEIVVTLLHVQAAPGDAGFAWTITGAAVATLQRDTLAVTAITDVPAMTIATATGPVVLGETILVQGRYLYAYGTRKTTGTVEHFVARTDRATAPLGIWSVWDGKGWSTDATHLAPLRVGGAPAVTALSVTAHGDGFQAVGLASLQPGPILRWTARSPAGPWRSTTPAGAATAPTGGIAYGAHLVTVPDAGEILGHSFNDVAPDAVVLDPSRYGVRFTTVAPYDHRP